MTDSKINHNNNIKRVPKGYTLIKRKNYEIGKIMQKIKTDKDKF